MNNPIQTTTDGVLRCPHCGFNYTHVDLVDIAARREDEPAATITADAITGQVITNSEVPAPLGTRVGEGRRQRIALVGHCEGGCDFAFVFTQHKGETYVELADPFVPSPHK